MKLYFAPMEGITTYYFRNAHAEMFGGCDQYFAPFLVPTENERISARTLRDILPERNDIPVIPQVLCNDGKAFSEFIKKIKPLGFDTVNLNFGCPSGTVTKKYRGSGILRDLDLMDRFLYQIFSEHEDINISIKTRTGFYSHAEFDEILKIYQKYPISELMIHPRIREEYYNGTPNMQSFDLAYQSIKSPLCYNGNVYTTQDFERIESRYPKLNSIMLGRGVIKNPALFREIKGGKPLETQELISFSALIEKRCLELLGSEVYTLHRLKEMWLYMMQNFPEEKKILKAVKKANRISDLNHAIGCLPAL
ncbi:MAG: tRNA-dihydrouridine synthase family protein [Ruminococcaceae bacterium]|nr:tRNA-dihydrouridine synthase family protein [Oscillospiraceae bacterium]